MKVYLWLLAILNFAGLLVEQIVQNFDSRKRGGIYIYEQTKHHLQSGVRYY